MEQKYWTPANIKQFFKFDQRKKSINTLYTAEAENEIPIAERIIKGQVESRHWREEDIPKIGEKFGFLPKNRIQKVICKYIQKGGVLKTTSTFNEARIFALNGLKTLIIGLDFECSITDIVKPKHDIQTLEDNEVYSGLYHFFYEKASIEEIICKTSLPTLDIIPETHDLVRLDKNIASETRRECLFKDKLIPKLKDYDVIIFDNGPSWNYLIENALTASNVVIAPLGCNLLSYNAAQTNFQSIEEFQSKMSEIIKDQEIIMYATLLDRNSLSQQIFAQYLSTFTDKIIDIPIRTSVKVQEAIVLGLSLMEYMPKNPLAQDYYELIQEVWKRITKGDVITKATKKRLKDNPDEDLNDINVQVDNPETLAKKKRATKRKPIVA